MKINRETLLKVLRFAQLGASMRSEILEQSNAFVFKDGELITFNEEILTRAPSPLDFTAAILADEFIKLVEKIPDEELDIEIKDNEVVLEGSKKRRSAGVTCFSEIRLPYDKIPAPKNWTKLEDGTFNILQQAARTCGKDVTQELTRLVHVTPDMVEACDNFRLFRAEMETGFPEEGLLPAESVMKLSGLNVEQVAVGEGWAHFKTKDEQVVSIRCSHEKYHEGLDDLLDIGEAEKVSFPVNLGEIVSRTVVMMNAEEEPHVRVKLTEGQLTVESRKDSGWYRERKRVKYDGEEMEFDVNPKFLVEILQRTKEVLVSKSHRMKFEAEGIQFVVALNKPE